jgi:hypothetical protein
MLPTICIYRNVSNASVTGERYKWAVTDCLAIQILDSARPLRLETVANARLSGDYAIASPT